MIIKEKGNYVLLKDVKTSNAGAICQLRKGTILYITQIDVNYRKVIGEPLFDWTYWDLPVRKLATEEK